MGKVTDMKTELTIVTTNDVVFSLFGSLCPFL